MLSLTHTQTNTCSLHIHAPDTRLIVHVLGLINARSECEESTHDARLCAKQPLRSHSLGQLDLSVSLPPTSNPSSGVGRRDNCNVSMLLLWHFAAMAINAEVISGVFFWHFARRQGILQAPTFSSTSATSLHTLLSACLRPSHIRVYLHV